MQTPNQFGQLHPLVLALLALLRHRAPLPLHRLGEACKAHIALSAAQGLCFAPLPTHPMPWAT
jgi:hypothetical protein